MVLVFLPEGVPSARVSIRASVFSPASVRHDAFSTGTHLEESFATASTFQLFAALCPRAAPLPIKGIRACRFHSYGLDARFCIHSKPSLIRVLVTIATRRSNAQKVLQAPSLAGWWLLGGQFGRLRDPPIAMDSRSVGIERMFLFLDVV